MLGQAAGVMVALALQRDTTPRRLGYERVRDALLERGAGLAKP